MAEFEIIDDVTKAIPKGKDLKKFTPFIIAGLGLGVVTLMFRNKSGSASGSMISDESGVGQSTDLGGLMADFTNQTNEAIKRNNEALVDGVDGKLSTVIGNLYDVIENQNTKIDQLKKEATSQINSDTVYNHVYQSQSESGSVSVSSFQNGVYGFFNPFTQKVDDIPITKPDGTLTDYGKSQISKIEGQVIASNYQKPSNFDENRGMYGGLTPTYEAYVSYAVSSGNNYMSRDQWSKSQSSNN